MTWPDLPQHLLAAVIAIGVMLASVRMLVGAWRGDSESRPRAWRITALLLLQAASGALLFLALDPPARSVETGTMVVLTAGAGTSASQGAGEFVVSLPEATESGNIERVPDLGTALRRYPAVKRLRIVGGGLVARDREMVSGRALAFDPAPLQRGIVEFWTPATVQSGMGFPVTGRVHDMSSGTVELLDPSGQRRDQTKVDANGRFSLQGHARSAGLATFKVSVRDGNKQEVDVADVPLQVLPAHSSRVLMLAGGPSPELKYLRRWAADAGLDARVEISLGGGMHIGDGTTPFNAETLDRFDLVVLDERAWGALSPSRYAALRNAMQRGLGVLVRISGPVSGRAGSRLRALGFRVVGARLEQSVKLPSEPGPGAKPNRADPDSQTASDAGNSAADKTLPALSRQPLRISASDGSVLIHDAQDNSLAVWRALGRGRIAAWNVSDTYQMVLTGHQDRHARLWSAAFSTLARADGAQMPTLASPAIEGQRVVICGVSGSNDKVSSPLGTVTTLLPDLRSGPRDCAGYWPRSSGWHWLSDGEKNDGRDRRPWPFHVRAKDALPGVRALELREATMRLVSTDATTDVVATRIPGPRWPWFLVWLAASGLLWWLERSRFGRR